MSKPDFSVRPRLTPAQAVGIIGALEQFRRDYEHSARWRSQFDGAQRGIERALRNAGWTENNDGKGWHRSG